MPEIFVLMFFISFIMIAKVIVIYLEIAASQNATSGIMIQPEIKSSSLRGGYRPPEVERNLTRNRDCSGSFAKYLVSIRKYENDKSFGHKHLCGGVIIRSNIILTAAHCFISKEQLLRASSVRVVARTPVRLRKTQETQVIRVQKIKLHELFLTSLKADIALLKLRKHIKLDRNCAALVNVPERRINASTNCVILGWGKLFYNGPLANEILQLNVTLHSKEFCDPFFLNTDKRKICASDRRDNEKHPCSGDSGGPLFCDGVLTGIVSYGFQCHNHFPTVYTDIYEYRNWIKDNKGHTLKCVFVIFFPITLFVCMLTN